MCERDFIPEAERHIVRLCAFEKRLETLRRTNDSGLEYNETYMILVLLATSIGSGSVKELARTLVGSTTAVLR